MTGLTDLRMLLFCWGPSLSLKTISLPTFVSSRNLGGLLAWTLLTVSAVTDNINRPTAPPPAPSLPSPPLPATILCWGSDWLALTSHHITRPEMLAVWDPGSNWTTSLMLSSLPIISWERNHLNCSALLLKWLPWWEGGQTATDTSNCLQRTDRCERNSIWELYSSLMNEKLNDQAQRKGYFLEVTNFLSVSSTLNCSLARLW